MFKVSNLADLKRSITLTVLFSLVFFFLLSVVSFIWVNNQSKQSIKDERVHVAADLLEINLHKYIYMTANAPFFVRFLHAGPVTRDRESGYIATQLSLIEPAVVVGHEIRDKNDVPILQTGRVTDSAIEYNICYLDGILDPQYGYCNHVWRVYLSQTGVAQAFHQINPDITYCEDCKPYQIFNQGGYYNDLPVEYINPIIMNFDVASEVDGRRLALFLSFFICLAGFAYLSHYQIKRMFNNYIAIPIQKITHKLEKDESLDFQCRSLSELHYMADQINDWKQRMQTIKEKEQAVDFGKNAAQVAHDIRSPVATLRIMLDEIIDIPEKHSSILKKATDSINDIANHLLFKYKENSDKEASVHSEPTSVQSVYLIAQHAVSEKRFQYPDIKFTFTAPHARDVAFARLQCQMFKRVLSNIVNNAIDSLTINGEIDVKISVNPDYIILKISDNGCGIAPDILPHVLEEGYSHGKKHGNGLGLSHAQSCLKAWGGYLQIQSSLDYGTTVLLALPTAPVPAHVMTSLKIKQHSDVILVDDDESILLSLKEKLRKHLSPEDDVTIHAFNRLDEFITWYQNNTHGEHLIFMDYEFKGEPRTGLAVIKELNLTQCSILSTSHYENTDIRADCKNNKLPLVPKELILLLPIQVHD